MANNGNTPAQPGNDQDSILNKIFANTISLKKEFEEAVALPAPERSLYTPQSTAIARNLFQNENTIFFGELHDDVNYKFLTDNPDFFKALKDQGGKYAFVELPVNYKQLFQDYFDDKISNQKLASEFTVFPTSGENYHVFAQEIAAFCKTAKENGVRVIPADFRHMNDLSSDAFGIPDIAGRDDLVRKLTLQSLQEFKHTKGMDYPLTKWDESDLHRIYANLAEELPESEKIQLEKDKAARSPAADKTDLESTQFQNIMEARYYTRLVQPGEKSIFMGGSRHFEKPDSMPNLLEDNGYGRVAGIRLRSDASFLYDRVESSLEQSFKEAAKNPNLVLPEVLVKIEKDMEQQRNENRNKYDYILHTETGEALDRNGKQLPIPATTTNPQDKQRQKILEPMS